MNTKLREMSTNTHSLQTKPSMSTSVNGNKRNRVDSVNPFELIRLEANVFCVTVL